MTARLFVVAGAYAGVLSAFAALYVPQANERTIQASPLKPGEVAYLVGDNGRATLAIGGDGAAPLAVGDATTVHGCELADIPRADFTVVGSGGMTYNGQTDTWSAPAAICTNTIVVQSLDGLPIYDIDYDIVNEYTPPDAIVPMVVGDVSHVVNGDTATITVERFEPNGVLSVGKFKMRRVLRGDPDEVNDLTKLHVTIRDAEGVIDLGSLRSWGKHLYDGNRGEHWASYPANHDVRMGVRAVRYGRKGRYLMREDSSTNLVFMAGGRDAITVAFHGMAAGAGSFAITNYSRSGGTVTLGYTIDVDNFDAAQVGVLCCVDLQNDPWRALAPGEFSANATAVTIPNQQSVRCYYRLTYGEMSTAALAILLRGRVIVEDELLLRGSGASTNKLYRLTVDGGTISATEVQL